MDIALSGRKEHFVSQIFWPDSLLNCKSHGYLVGWNLENFRCCIACAISSDQISLELLQSFLLNKNIIGVELGRPIILGEFVPAIGQISLKPTNNVGFGIWLTLTFNDDDTSTKMSNIRLHSLYSCGFLYRTSSYLFRYQSVVFTNIWNFMIFDNNDNLPCCDNNTVGNSSNSEVFLTISQINYSGLLQYNIQNTILHGNQIPTNLLPIISFPLNYQIITTILYFTIKFSTLLMHLLSNNYSHYLGTQSSVNRQKNKITDISYLANHIVNIINIEYQSFYISCNFLQNWNQSILKNRKYWAFIHNYVIYLTIDLFIGLLFGNYLYYNFESLLLKWKLAEYCIHQNIILDSFVWFHNSPMGVKLNPVLTSFLKIHLTKIFLEFLKFCQYFTMIPRLCLNIMIVCSIFGFSTQLAVFTDLLSLLTIHFYGIHYLFSLQIKLHFSLLCSLLNLFGGRKKNVFRFRIDSSDFDRYQLLLGTLLFSVLFFLFPTFLIYYSLFFIIHASVLLVQLLVSCLFYVVVMFPYYFCLMKIWDFALVSDGFMLEVIENSSNYNYSNNSGLDNNNNNSNNNNISILSNKNRNKRYSISYNMIFKWCRVSSYGSDRETSKGSNQHSTTAIYRHFIHSRENMQRSTTASNTATTINGAYDAEVLEASPITYSYDYIGYKDREEGFSSPYLNNDNNHKLLFLTASSSPSNSTPNRIRKIQRANRGEERGATSIPFLMIDDQILHFPKNKLSVEDKAFSSNFLPRNPISSTSFTGLKDHQYQYQSSVNHYRGRYGMSTLLNRKRNPISITSRAKDSMTSLHFILKKKSMSWQSIFCQLFNGFAYFANNSNLIKLRDSLLWGTPFLCSLLLSGFLKDGMFFLSIPQDDDNINIDNNFFVDSSSTHNNKHDEHSKKSGSSSFSSTNYSSYMKLIANLVREAREQSSHQKSCLETVRTMLRLKLLNRLCCILSLRLFLILLFFLLIFCFYG